MNTSVDRSFLKDAPYAKELQKEIVGVKRRVEEFFDLVVSAEVEKVAVVVGCDDQRVEVPGGVQKVKFADGEKNTVFHFVPSIGGGKDNFLVDVLDYWTKREEKRIPKEKISVFVTSHGSSQTLDSGGKKVTCGALGVRAAYKSAFAKIDKADDEERERLLDELYEDSGIAKRLLRHIAQSTFSSNVYENTKSVMEAMKGDLAKKDLQEVSLEAGVYNHNTRGIHLDSEVISIPGLERWEEDYQDPQAIVISCGALAASVPDSVLYPQTVGVGANNDFNIASGEDIESILQCFCEASYATEHSGQAGHNDFARTDRIVVTVSSSEGLVNFKKALATDEFKQDYAEAIVKKFGGLIYLVNLQDETVEAVKLALETGEN